MYNSYSSTSSNSFNPVFIFLFVIVLVITLIAYWKVFVKAGEPGWKAIIPIYNIIIAFRIAGRQVYWAILLLIPIVNFFIAAYLYIGLGRTFGKSPVWSLILLWLLGPIGIIILAFDKSTYTPPGTLSTPNSPTSNNLPPAIPQQPVAP